MLKAYSCCSPAPRNNRLNGKDMHFAIDAHVGVDRNEAAVELFNCLRQVN